jgi:pyruvate/2-oxoglutarate dehydrogenase complex dihydrolipoamide acyltransferase (E2) component
LKASKGSDKDVGYEREYDSASFLWTDLPLLLSALAALGIFVVRTRMNLIERTQTLQGPQRLILGGRTIRVTSKENRTGQHEQWDHLSQELAGTHSTLMRHQTTDHIRSDQLNNKTTAPKKEAHVPQTADTPSSKLVSPAVAHLLLKHHITDVTKIPSTGPKGRVLKGDVLAFLGLIKARPAPEPTIPQPKTLPPAQPVTPSSASAPSGAAYTDSPASTMRKVIASRLSESKSNLPHSYVSRDIVIDNMMKLRRLLAGKFAIDLYFIQDIVRVL